MEENVISTTTESVETTVSSESTTPETSVEVETSSEESTSEAPKVVAEAGGMKVVVDPVTGKRSIEYGSDEGEQETDEEQPPEANSEGFDDDSRGTDTIGMGQQNLANAEKYNLDEFSAALANGRVDPNRVPQEYQAQYADYRIKQAIQERQTQQRMAYEQEQYQRQRIAQQMSPEARVQANKDFYKALGEEAGNLALRDLGLTQEQLDDAEFADNGDEIKAEYERAKTWHTQRLQGEMQARYQQEQAYRSHQQGVYADIQSFVAEQRAKEPNFDAIDKTLATRYKTLPYEQAKVIESALQALQAGTISPRGVEVIQKYYNDSRKEYYANKNGLNVNKPKTAARKPPAVESAGTGQQVARQYKPDYGKLRGANVNERSAWFKDYFKNNGW